MDGWMWICMDGRHGWMDGWLVRWLVGSLVGWLVGRLVGCVRAARALRKGVCAARARARVIGIGLGDAAGLLIFAMF